MAALWITWTDADGNDGSARWGDVSDVLIDKITALAEDYLGSPDTVE